MDSEEQLSTAKNTCPILPRAAIQPLKDNQEKPTDFLCGSFFQPIVPVRT